MNPNIMKAFGFDKEVEAVQQGKCPFCGKVVDPQEFRAEINEREFKISGLCQSCQDQVFGK